MNHSIKLAVKTLASIKERVFFAEIFGDIADALSCQMYTSGALAIKTGGSALAKVGTLCYGINKGKPFSIAANTDMAALSGTVVNATFNVYVFDRDSAGTLTSAMGTAGATLAAVSFPARVQGKTRIGYVIINPTGTGDFVGGTTALDNGTVVPNAVYVNLIGASEHSIVR